MLIFSYYNHSLWWIQLFETLPNQINDSSVQSTRYGYKIFKGINTITVHAIYTQPTESIFKIHFPSSVNRTTITVCWFQICPIITGRIIFHNFGSAFKTARPHLKRRSRGTAMGGRKNQVRTMQEKVRLDWKRNDQSNGGISMAATTRIFFNKSRERNQIRMSIRASTFRWSKRPDTWTSKKLEKTSCMLITPLRQSVHLAPISEPRPRAPCHPDPFWWKASG